MPRMGKTEEDWNGLKSGFLKTVQPNSFSKLISAACNCKVMLRRHIFLFRIFSFTCHFVAYFKFHSDWRRVRLTKLNKINWTLPWHSPFNFAPFFFLILVACLQGRDMTLYMRKVLTSPQPSFSSMSLAALKYNKQEDSSVRRQIRKLVLIRRIKVISCTVFQYLITTAS